MAALAIGANNDISKLQPLSINPPVLNAMTFQYRLDTFQARRSHISRLLFSQRQKKIQNADPLRLPGGDGDGDVGGRVRPPPTQTSAAPIADALAVCRMTYFLEFPLLSKKALEFALFKTFAIPSISKLLAATRQFSPTNVTKRYDDTHILVEELLLSHVDSPRGSLALRRLNFIHSHYNISNSDFLYTLSTFMFEPKRFASRFGYRNWTEKETTANFVLWRSIGIRMGIEDIPETVEEMEKFSLQYEADNMVYSHSNRKVADATLDLMLSIVPACFRPSARYIVYCVLEERLVDAMGYPRLPYWLISMVTATLKFFLGTFVGLFLPPRPLAWSTERISMEVEEEEDIKEREKVHNLRYSEYKPETYPKGYRMDELGYAELRQLGTAFAGDIPCPFFSSFSNHNSNKKLA